jgi:hypothetical protein
VQRIDWSPAGWRSTPTLQQPSWPDQEQLDAAVASLGAAPALATTADIRGLSEALRDVALGRALLLQAGDCAESFLGSSSGRLDALVELLQQMAGILAESSGTAAAGAGIGMSFFVSPSTSDERVRQIADAAQDWIYVVAVPGVTGARARVEELTSELLRRTQRLTQPASGRGIRSGSAGPHEGARGHRRRRGDLQLGHGRPDHGHRDRPAELLFELDRYVREMKAASRRDPSFDSLVRSL